MILNYKILIVILSVSFVAGFILDRKLRLISGPVFLASVAVVLIEAIILSILVVLKFDYYTVEQILLLRVFPKPAFTILLAYILISLSAGGMVRNLFESRASLD